MSEGVIMKKREARSSRLLEMLQHNRQLDVKTVAESLAISEATVRRLFAWPLTSAPATPYYLSSTHRSREKAAIGRAAAELVSPGDRIFLDSGTTVLKLAEALALRIQSGSPKDIVVLTHSLALAETLARWCKVILVGGEVRVERRDVCGSITEDTLRQFHVTRAFFGADAVHVRHGFMTTDEQTAKMSEIIIQRATHSFVLADSEKFNRDSFIRYASLADVEKIITNAGIPEEVVREYTEAGAHIEVVRR
jgi:DeoR/GlpR family transcriptional regulator of sugar metabolism